VGRLDAPLHAGTIGSGQPWSKNSRSINRGMDEEHVADTCNNAMKPYYEFCEEQGLHPLSATAATIARYIALIGTRGTSKATSPHPYLSDVNESFRDHGAEPIAKGDLGIKIKRGLAASKVSLHPSRTRMYLLARVPVSSLRLTEDLRTQLTDTWTQNKTDKILLFRACMATTTLSYFLSRGRNKS
jgi:hypothetical protein